MFDQSRLFVIIGIGRSGTTILQEIMNTFEGFCNLEESRVGPNMMSCYAFVRKSNDFSHLEKFIENNWTGKYFVEKTPNSILCLPQLHARYPNANYLFLERHPLKILLSQMNMHPSGEADQWMRKYDIEAGNVEKEDLELNFEQYKAKRILVRVKAQIQFKHLFANQLTIRYENFVKDNHVHLEQISKKFNITPNFEKAKEILARPSQSSKNNRYEISSVSDSIAIQMINDSCSLWNYEKII